MYDTLSIIFQELVKVHMEYNILIISVLLKGDTQDEFYACVLSLAIGGS